MNCITKIKQLYSDLTRKEKKIADAIFKEPEKISKFNSYELAEYTDTSPATVIRISKKLGFKSYADMKVEIAKSTLIQKAPEISKLIKKEDSTENLMKKIVLNINSILKKMIEITDVENIERAVSSIKNADTVYLYGIGASAIVAQDFQQKLIRINKKCVFFNDYHLALASSLFITEKDVVVAFSYSGNTKEVNKAVEQAKKNNATTIGVTKCINNKLSSLVDISLDLINTEKDIRLGAIQSRYSMLIVIDILFALIAKDNFSEVEKYIKNTRKIIDNIKEKK